MAIQKASRVELQYRGYTILAAVLNRQPTASILRGSAPATKDRFLGDTVPEAVEAAKGWIDAKHRNSAAQRRRPNVGTAQEYVDAFTRRQPTESELKMLRAHAAAGVLTATQLAKAAGYRKYSTANAQYGKLGHDIADLIELQPELRRDGSKSWITTLIEGLDEGDESSGHFRSKLHNEVKEALQHLRYLQVGPADH